MAKILTEAGGEMRRFVNRVLEAEYPEAAALSPGILFGVLWATNDKDGKPALTHGGYPAAAIISVVNLENRAAGGPDVILQVDHDRWRGLTEEERYALVHHELHHVLVTDLRPWPEGPHFTCKVDDLGRPKVTLRKHDFEIGGFDLIVEKHGEAALEWQYVKGVHERFVQQTLPFAGADDVAGAKARKKA